ncbi:MAG: beta-galactosidase [Clostridia bacterium]|nr:beta-galactosidase [Clostridia bacterium]
MPVPADPEVFVRVSDKLELPLIIQPARTDSILKDLNADLLGDASGESLHAQAFALIFEKIVIFRTGECYHTAYVCGDPVDIGESVLQTETGYYIALSTLADVFGGTYSETELGAVLAAQNMTVTATGDRAYLHAAGEGYTEDDEIETSTVSGAGVSVNVKDAAKLYGLTEYHTDAGLVFFSAGQAFDPVCGYYIAEEAEKLYLSEADAAAYSANMFVDIPNIAVSSERNVTAYSYPALDINANVAAYAAQGVEAEVALGPAIVAGQGEDAANYTVVRVFDQYQTLHTQFSAYPATVRGGVQVAAARSGDKFRILTAPFTSKEVRELRCYDANGAFLFPVSPSGDAPFAIASGAFLGEEDVFAVTSRNCSEKKRVIEFFSAEDGSLISSEKLPVRLIAGVLLSADRVCEDGDALLIYAEDNILAYRFGREGLSELSLAVKRVNGIYASAFGGYMATYDADDINKAFSETTEYKDGEVKTVNVGAKENLFVSTAADEGGEYVKKGQFWHTRLEFATAAHSNTTPGDTSSIRKNDISSFTVTPGRDVLEKYNTQYNMWEPCTTHRWNKTAGMGNLISYVDPDTGMYGYATLTKENERSDYVEFESSYFNGTYAPFIEAMDRYNFWTRRTYLQELGKLYREAPEYTVAVSPVHEHEIDSGSGSVGDYNPRMIAGFRLYLKDLYGTIENVNEKFGTSFACFGDLDAPRNAGRGDWDRYPASSADRNEYFDQWTIYNRTAVSQYLVASYREALLAGFPPELIKAHQIPEGDAVAGFLGEADTRISPVDVALATGTGYGGTRYSTWFRDRNSFMALAKDSGHNNVTLGEYSAMNTDKFESYRQLRYLFNNGVVFTHVMGWTGGVQNGDKMDAGEKYAVDRLMNENRPRSASSGGTGNIIAYSDGDISFNIVEIGSKKSSPGLLKSVNEDGSFEGTVYLQPFHAAVIPVDISKGDRASGTGRLRYEIGGKKDANGKSVEGINYGDTVDLRLNAKPCGEEPGTITVQVWHDGYEDAVASYTFEVTGAEEEYRYTFKNQLFLTDCSITVTYRGVEITDSDVTLLYERTARKFYGETSPQAHRGGVSFDVMQ